MMDVRINHDNLTVIATGHADAPRNEDGRDMVCCAASTLIQAFIFSCEALPGVMVTKKIRPGDVYLKLSTPDCHYTGVMHRMQMLEDGMTHLSAQFPSCITMK